jgi:iron complex outermembrane receptor protein
VQPSARFVWTPSNKQTIWGAVSRAVRNPSIIDRNIEFRLPTVAPNSSNPANPFPIPISLQATGNPNVKSEKLIAYELGYRIFFDNSVSLDISAFYNDYDDLTTVEEVSSALDPGPPPHISGQVITTNNLTAESYGIELDASWQVMDQWRLSGYYSFIRMFFHQNSLATNVSGEGGEEKVPQHQFSLRSSMDFSEQLHWDLWLRYVDALPNRNVTDYTTLDTRVAWRPLEQLELSVVGQNLIDSGHSEYTTEFVKVTNSVIERSFYFKVDWEF